MTVVTFVTPEDNDDEITLAQELNTRNKNDDPGSKTSYFISQEKIFEAEMAQMDLLQTTHDLSFQVPCAGLKLPKMNFQSNGNVFFEETIQSRKKDLHLQTEKSSQTSPEHHETANFQSVDTKLNPLKVRHRCIKH